MSYETNLKANRIGVITVKNLYDFKLALDETKKEFTVTGKDGFVWGRGKSTKGAMISALHQGIRLRDVDIRDHYVPIKEVLDIVKA